MVFTVMIIENLECERGCAVRIFQLPFFFFSSTTCASEYHPILYAFLPQKYALFDRSSTTNAKMDVHFTGDELIRIQEGGGGILLVPLY